MAQDNFCKMNSVPAITSMYREVNSEFSVRVCFATDMRKSSQDICSFKKKTKTNEDLKRMLEN